eukprot:2943578-Amphidinium_carterae.1
MMLASRIPIINLPGKLNEQKSKFQIKLVLQARTTSTNVNALRVQKSRFKASNPIHMSDFHMCESFNALQRLAEMPNVF